MIKWKQIAIGAMCAVVFIIILTVGLWPFHAPRNKVRWLPNGNGLFIGTYGTLVSSGAFPATSSREEKSCSLEIRLEPGAVYGSKSILSFYQPDKGVTAFSLHQWKNNIVLRREIAGKPPEKVKFDIENVFHLGREVVLTITSGKQGTVVYIDGALARRSEQFGLSSPDFTGQLIINNSAVAHDGGAGQLRGIAIYNRELTAAEALENADVWTRKGQPATPESQGLVALYLFREGTGNVVHNQVQSGVDLFIPDRYLVLHEPFLQVPWKEFYPTWGYCQDVIVNIVGFIPFGFCFCAYFRWMEDRSRPLLATVALGASVSLTIEVLQSFLPTRDSGMTDLMTNTLGTTLGAWLSGSQLAKSLFWDHFFRIIGRPATRVSI